MMSASALQTSIYEDLLNHLTVVLQLAQKAEGILSPQAKQVLLNATNEFKNALSRAKDTAANLPGGEMVTEEQDDVLAMLVKLRDRKREQLVQFTNRTITTSEGSGTETKMEVDSMASTPFYEG